MVSIRSATWTVVLIEMVLSCAMFIASMAVVAAESQSTTLQGEPRPFSTSVIVTCLLSACVIVTAIFAMFGLSNQQACLLLPHAICSLVVIVFHASATAVWLIDWVKESGVDGDWIIAFGGMLLFQASILTGIYLEMRSYMRVS